jgi:tRNA-intron endonuclease
MFPTAKDPQPPPEESPESEDAEGLGEGNEGDEGEEQRLENFTGLLRDATVEITDPSAADSLHQQSYFGEQGEGGTLLLAPEEVLVLHERKRLHVVDDSGEELGFDAILKHFSESMPNLWIQYLVYRDLRTRGYIVRRGMGDGIDFRVYKRGAKKGTDEAKYLIFTVVEGKPLELRVLDKITKYSISSRKKLVLAVVDRLGEITYYSVDQYNLK